jgi:hypothetical protein
MPKNVSNNASQVSVQSIPSVGSKSSPGFSFLSTDKGEDSASSAFRDSDVGSRQIGLSFTSEADEILSERALSNNMPEIVTLTGFLPTSSELGIDTLASLMLNLQVSLKNLLKEDNEILIEKLSNDDNFSSAIEDLVKEYQSVLSSTQNDISTMASILEKINAMKNALNLLESSFFESDFSEIRSRRMTSSSGVKTKGTTTSLNQPTALSDILVEHLGFDRDNVAKFSNTRAFAQIISDLYTALVDFTPQLLGTNNYDRGQDSDPVVINKSRVDDGDFDFTPSSFSSAVGFDPADASFFDDFQSSLPTSIDGHDNRIRVLLSALSKEYRISKGLGGLAITGKTYNNPLDEIVGNVGEKITDVVADTSSLASILHLSDNDDVILPFETRQIRQDQSLFIPGSVYLVDNILRGDSSFVTFPLSTFASSLSQTAEEALSTVDGLLQLDDAEKTMHFATMFDDILGVVKDSVSSLGSSHITSDSQALGAALLVACQSDANLKFDLFNYFLSVYSGDIISTSVYDFLDGGEEIAAVTPMQNRATDVLGNSLASNPVLSGKFSEYVPAKSASPTDSSKGTTIAGLAPGITSIGSPVTTASSIIVGTASTASGLELILTPNVSIATLSSRIKAAISSANETTYPASVTLTIEEISDILGDADNNDFIFVKMADYAKQNLDLILHESSSSAFNKLSYQTVLLFLFELFSSIFAEYVEVGFIEITADNSVIGYNQTSIANNLTGAMEAVETTTVFNQDTTKDTEIVSGDDEISDAFDSLRSSFALEDEIIQDLVDTIRTVATSITQTADTVVDYFETASAKTSLDLAAFFETDAMKATLRGISDLQVTLALRALSILFSSDDGLTIPDNQYMTSNQVDTLQSLLNKPEYQSPSGNNLRILAAGMPSGLTAALLNSEYDVDSDEPIRIASGNLVTVKVYRTDLEYGDLVFKPRSFVFDTLSFVENAGNVRSVDTSFANILEKYMSYRTYSPESGTSSTRTASFLSSLTQFDDLDDDQIEIIYENHAISELLGRYIKLMTGMDLSEYTFLYDEEQLKVPFSESAQVFFDTWVAVGGLNTDSTSTFMVGEIAGLNEGVLSNLQDVLTAEPLVASLGSISPLVTTTYEETGDDSEVEDESGSTVEETSWIDELNQETLSRFKRLITSAFFSKDIQRVRVLQPKLFERVFLIPVDPDDFEIDEEAMQDMDLWKDEAFQQKVVIESSGTGANEVTTYRLESRDIEFAEMYINVELGGQFE